MSWQEKLRPASWRGVPFFVQDHQFTGGRRVQVHDFIQRDKPYVEDLGRDNRNMTVKAYVIASYENNFDAWPQRDALIRAIEQGGKGTFVHPSFGELEGHISKFTEHEDNSQQGGYCGFDLVFIEAGEKDFKVISRPDTLGTAKSEVLASYTAVSQDFAKQFSVDNVSGFVRDDALATVTQLTEQAESLSASGSFDFQQAMQYLDELLNGNPIVPITLAAAIIAIIKDLNDVGSFEAFQRPEIPAINTTSRAQQRANNSAFVALVRTAAAIRRAELSVDLVSTSARYASTDSTDRSIPALITRSDMVARRQVVARSLFDRQAELSKAGIFQLTQAALPTLRASAVTHMTTEGEDLAKTFTTSCCEGTSWQRPMATIVLAYRYYDSLTDDVINKRNNIVSPLFIPPHAPVELLALEA
jgi:prophage DNA circulation protein